MLLLYFSSDSHFLLFTSPLPHTIMLVDGKMEVFGNACTMDNVKLTKQNKSKQCIWHVYMHVLHVLVHAL